MQEGKITKQDKGCYFVWQKGSPRLAESQLPPGSIASRARPTRPRQQAHLSARPEPVGADGRKESHGPTTREEGRGAALAPHCRLALLGESLRPPPPQGNNSRRELAGLGMTLTGYRSVPGGRDFRFLSLTGRSDFRACSGEGGGSWGHGGESEWDPFTPQSGLGFINISVSVALQYFVMEIKELCSFLWI